jgi:periplasmic copper chaperone A
MRIGRSARVGAALASGVAVGAMTFAGAAAAHVTVDPTTATQGGYSRIVLRVPTESDTASTVKLDVFLDMAHPIASVATMPVPGWSVRVTTAKLAKPLINDDGDEVTQAVSEIVWTVNSPASAIKPGEFEEFALSLGPLPDVPSLAFKALQTYSDGTVVRWIDATPAGGPEPEHPAPVLTLLPAGTGAASPDAGAAAPAATAAAASTSGSNASAMTLAIIGGLLGLVGAVLGGAAYARSRPAPPAE